MKAIFRVSNIVGCAVMLAAISLSLSASAQSFIDRQQAELSQKQPLWHTPRIPEGMQSGPLRKATARDSGAQALSLEARNVDFDVTGDIGFHIQHLAATLEPVTAGEPVQFDDPRTFAIRIHNGEVTIPPKALNALFNRHILEYAPRPLDDMKITTSKEGLAAKAGLKLWNWFPGVWLGAKLVGPITLNKNNEMVYSPQDVRVLGIPLGGLLRTLGIKLNWLLSVDREGANLVGNELILNHRKVFPPPALSGNIASAELSEAGLHLVFADNPAAKFSTAPKEAKSYLWIQSGDAKLFDVIVANANLLIVDEKKDDVLHFNLYDYRQQVLAGTLVMSEDGSITARVPSYRHLAEKSGQKQQ